MPSLPPNDIARITDYVAGELASDDMVETERWIAADDERKALVDYLQRSRDNVQQTLAVRVDFAQILETIRVEARRSEVLAVSESGAKRQDYSTGPSRGLSHGDPAEQTVKIGRAVRGPLPSAKRFGVGLVRRGGDLGKHSLRRRISWEKQLFSPKYAFGIVTLILAVLSVVFSQAPLTPSRVHQYKTVRAQRVVVHLADGSTALLGPATTLTVAPESIVLAGEAYFTIAPHPTHPLVIRTRNTTIGVLGTQFGVRQYSEDSTTRVVVAEGKVTLHPFHTAAQTVLTERMLAQVTDSGVIVEQGVAVREYMGWVHGDLIFNRATMYDVVQELARAYDADIRIADTVLARQPMTIEVSVKDEPLSLILTDMALTAHAHLQRDGRSYVIFPGLSSSGNPQPKQIPQSEKIYGR